MLMKKTFLTFMVLLSAMGQVLADDLPSFVSKSGVVKWFYLHNVAYDVYLYNTGTDVISKSKAGFDNFADVARQLWCFTTDDGELYTITNKYDGKQMDNALSAKYSNWESVQMKEEAAAKFKITFVGGDTIMLEADKAAPGGGEIYRFPTVYWNTDYNYLLWMVRESAGRTTSSQFVVEPYTEAEFPEVQNEQTVTYYNIVSAKTGSEGRMICDNTSAVDSKYKFTVESVAGNEENAQWRLVSMRPGRTALVNRATGNSISNSINADGAYNLLEADAKTVVAKTWGIDAVCEDEFAISSEGEDGVMRYLNNTSLGAEPESLELSAMPGSGFAWKFVKTGEVVDINDAKTLAPSVKVVNGKIVAEGARSVSVCTTDGIVLPASATLKRGIYIVTVDGNPVKVSVR